MSTHQLRAMGPWGRRECSCGERFEGDSAQQELDMHIAEGAAGMGIGKAICLVAQHVLATVARDENAINWGDFPDIGEHAWFRIIDRLDDIAPFPDPDEYREAYALLAARAETSA